MQQQPAAPQQPNNQGMPMPPQMQQQPGPPGPGGRPMQYQQHPGNPYPQQQMMMQGGQQFPQQQQMMAGGPPQFNPGLQNQGRGGYQGNQMYRQKQGGYQGAPQGMPQGINFNFPGNMRQGNPQIVKKDFSKYYSLYVGNLSNITFDQDLYKFFSSRGYKLAGAKVMFDRETSQSKCFGYLNFHSQEEADRCLQEQNNAKIDNKAIVLNRKKDADFDRNANVLALNLPKEMDQSGLNNLFKEFGNIKSTKLEVFKDGTSRGFGYIQFEKQESAQNAIAKLNGSVQGEKKQEIQVLIHAKKDDRESTGDKQFTNLFVSNLPAGQTSEGLREVFAEYGQINSCEINAKNNGTGFVSFQNHADAQKALEALHMQRKINNQVMIVSPHVYRKENELQGSGGNTQIAKNLSETYKSNIFVKFVPKNVTKEEFQAKFSDAGKIASVKLEEHKMTVNGESFSNYQKGYVLFEEVQSAQKAIQKFHNSHTFGFGQRPLEVDFWKSKADIQKSNEEKSIQDIIQLINIQKTQNRNINQMQQMQPMQSNQGGNIYQNMGDGNRGGKYNNRGTRGGNRGGRGRGGHHNKNNQGGQNFNQRQNQGHYNNQRQNQGQPGMPQPPQPQGQINPQQMQQQQPTAPQLQMINFTQPIDITPLQSLQGQARNEFVGNSIYGYIQAALGDEYAPRITGMLLDDNAGIDFKQLLTDSSYFTGKVYEAHQLILNSKQQQQE